MLLAKLPRQTRDKWVKRVLSIRRRQMTEPNLVDFIELVKDKNITGKLPLYSQSQKLISIVRNHQKAHNKIPSIKETS